MTKEFLYRYDSKIEFPLDESIDVLKEVDNDGYIIANIQTPHAEVYAPEINFYAQNTKDSTGDKIKNIKKLYDIRLAIYEMAEDFDYTEPVGDKLIIVSAQKNEELVKTFEELGFTVVLTHPSRILDVNGHIGKLEVLFQKDKENRVKVITDQILWFNAPDFAMKQSGVYDPLDIGEEKAFKKIKENKGEFKYKNYTKYDPDICQYHERQTEICGRCADVCPTVAIVKIDEKRHLEFSHIDCHGCGGCISVCPSGALDFTQMNRDSFSEVASFYKDKIALITPSQMELDSLELELKENVLPFPIEGRKYLHETHFLTLLQESGNPIIFYTDFISKGTGDAIDLINEIFKRKYNKKAIFVAQTKEELESAFSQLETLSECKYSIDNSGLMKREAFTYRLAHLVGDEDLGIIKTKEHIHYGNLKINKDTCTLCMSCVGACNVKALTAHPEDNTLRFNPSMCTNCGYCEFICPEKDCLEVVYDEMHLNRNYFLQNVMATDTLFACVECGKEFATTKSIEKIANMMIPMFGNDKTKIRALYCCAECKPKVTMQSFIDQKNIGKSI